MTIPAEALVPPYPYTNVYLEGMSIKLGETVYALDLNDSPSARYKPVDGHPTQFALDLQEREYPLTYLYSDSQGDVTLTVAISIGATSTLDTSTRVISDPEFTLGYYVMQFLPGWTGTPERSEQIHDAVVALVDGLTVVSNTLSVKPTPPSIPLQ